MIDAYCNKCRFSFTFTAKPERDAWSKRHPRSHKVEGRK